MPKIDLDSLGMDTPKQHISQPYDNYGYRAGGSLERALTVAKEVNRDIIDPPKYIYHYRSPADPVE